jgi:hypothetical protein
MGCRGRGRFPFPCISLVVNPWFGQGREIRLPTVKTCYGMLLGFSEQELKWQDWSLEREQERKRMHDNFLLERLGPLPYQFPWAEWFPDLDCASEEIVDPVGALSAPQLTNTSLS